MTLKTITVEFNETWGKGFRTFHGWVYYMSVGDSWEFYEIRDSPDHTFLTSYPKNSVKEITEKIL